MEVGRATRLERLRAVVAALQAAETVRFARSHAELQSRSGVHPKKIGKGIADQIGLACTGTLADTLRLRDRTCRMPY